MNKLWLVLGESEISPAKTQQSYKEVFIEASRLARSQPHDRFFILESVSCIKAGIPPLEIEVIQTNEEIDYAQQGQEYPGMVSTSNKE